MVIVLVVKNIPTHQIKTHRGVYVQIQQTGVLDNFTFSSSSFSFSFSSQNRMNLKKMTNHLRRLDTGTYRRALFYQVF